MCKFCCFWRRPRVADPPEGEIFPPEGEIFPPEDIKQLFYRYAENGNVTIDGLQRFLVECQGQSEATMYDAQDIYNNLIKYLHNYRKKGLDLDVFYRYLLGELNPPIASRVHHDMSAPLAHYFVFTGHNSYLTGNQLTSDSSVEPIINALGRGVRAIELDLWPNPTKNGVEVRHLWTVTRAVTLMECLSAIKNNAFVASKYPVVITFENHLPAKLQAEVVKMVKETFKETLYYAKDEPALSEFPSPESLRGKILISSKPHEYHEDDRSKESGATNHKDTEQDYHQDEDEVTAIPEYKQLISIHTRKPKSGLEMWHTNKLERLSLSEEELKNTATTHGTDIVRFTQSNLLRIYPKGSLVDLINYDPMLAWTHGAQMAAFNMRGNAQAKIRTKGHEKYLWIMEGMFRTNGSCGYVKKPDFLLTADPVFDPNESLLVNTILKVKVYLGEGWQSNFTHLSSPPGLYLTVGIEGVPNDQKLMKTKAIKGQWIPVWNEEFNFPLSVPELALLQVEVKANETSEKDDFWGQTCLPIAELKSGIRAVPLYNETGEKYQSIRLLMRFELNVYVE